MRKKKEKKIGNSISMYPNTWKILESRKLNRESRSQLVEDELHMFWRLLGGYCQDLYLLFTQDEFKAIVRCGAGLHLNIETFPCWLEGGVAVELSETPMETVADEAGIPYRAFLNKIENLSPLQSLALVDLLTRVRIASLKGYDRFEKVLPRFLPS